MKGPYAGRGLCPMTRTEHQRFLVFLTLGHPGGCWGWSGTHTAGPLRMAQLSIKGRSVLAHRIAYEHYVKHIEPGLVLDHLCRNPWCVNPYHQEPVTQRENNLRSDNMAARHHRQSGCKNGHPFDRVKSGGARACSVCARDRMDRFYVKHGRNYRSLRRQIQPATHEGSAA